MAEYKEFAVTLVTTTEHEYTVPARTAEEAVGIAEELFESGDEGSIVATSIDTADAVSGDIYAEAEEFEAD